MVNLAIFVKWWNEAVLARNTSFVDVITFRWFIPKSTWCIFSLSQSPAHSCLPITRKQSFENKVTTKAMSIRRRSCAIENDPMISFLGACSSTTSNYRRETAPYWWSLLRGGIFTSPSNPAPRSRSETGQELIKSSPKTLRTDINHFKSGQRTGSTKDKMFAIFFILTLFTCRCSWTRWARGVRTGTNDNPFTMKWNFRFDFSLTV